MTPSCLLGGIQDVARPPPAGSSWHPSAFQPVPYNVIEVAVATPSPDGRELYLLRREFRDDIWMPKFED
jgi:hypothetical protein